VTDGRRQYGGLFIGILVTAIGVVFLLDQMEIVHASYVFQVFWPVVLIALGLSILFGTRAFQNPPGAGIEALRHHTGNFWGPVLIVIGGLLLLSNLTNFGVGRLWPLWLVVIGVWLLLNRDRYDEIRSARRQRRYWRRYGRGRDWWTHGPTPGSSAGPNPTSAGFAGPGTGGHGYQANEWGANAQPPSNAPPPPGSPGGMPGGTPGPGPASSFVGPGFPGATESVDNTFERSVIFMSFNRRITSQHFRFGKVSAVFGGFHIDSTGAEMEGNQAVLQIEAVFGGGEIRIPPTWRVSVTAHEIAGAIVDETYSRPDAAAPAKVLLIHGTTVFGGVVIKN
jgi:LiaI-LiaF-like transmembrane region